MASTTSSSAALDIPSSPNASESSDSRSSTSDFDTSSSDATDSESEVERHKQRDKKKEKRKKKGTEKEKAKEKERKRRKEKEKAKRKAKEREREKKDQERNPHSTSRQSPSQGQTASPSKTTTGASNAPSPAVTATPQALPEASVNCAFTNEAGQATTSEQMDQQHVDPLRKSPTTQSPCESNVQGSSDSDEQSSRRRGTKDQYRDFGRMYCRIGTPFNSIHKIIEAGIEYDSKQLDSDSDTGRETAPSATKTQPAIDGHEPLLAIEQRRVHGYNILCRLMGPTFRKDLCQGKFDRKERKAIAARIQAGRDKARADDTSPLKVPALKYIRVQRGRSVKIGSETNKSLRGFNNKYTARLLVPLEYGYSDTVIKDIKDGKLTVTASQVPAFLYPQDQAIHPTGSSADLLAGFGYGHFAVRVAKHIFSGPSSALEGPGYHKGRSSNATLCGLNAMMPEAFAYAMIQARYALSSQPEWSLRDNQFDVEEFYWEMVNVMRLKQSKGLLQFYNEQIFGRKEGREIVTVQAMPDTPRQLSIYERMASAAALKRPSEEETEAIAKRARLDVQGLVPAKERKNGKQLNACISVNTSSDDDSTSDEEEGARKDEESMA
ncbi:hypothetical protein K474DRAFT_1679369 [Panus rudis PR-1116 ss-1]|nr:hypothetical protein K474DRAFT_1679369 [Panus rudis PR-1116 ss-1]